MTHSSSSYDAPAGCCGTGGGEAAVANGTAALLSTAVVAAAGFAVSSVAVQVKDVCPTGTTPAMRDHE